VLFLCVSSLLSSGAPANLLSRAKAQYVCGVGPLRALGSVALDYKYAPYWLGR
jgi:hypothetical protein